MFGLWRIGDQAIKVYNPLLIAREDPLKIPKPLKHYIREHEFG